MSKKIIKELESIGKQCGDSLFYVGDYEDFELVKQGDWVEDCKYSFCETIFKYKDKLFSVTQLRSGSYHSDYYYEEPEFCEVEPKEITEIYYIKVK